MRQHRIGIFAACAILVEALAFLALGLPWMFARWVSDMACDALRWLE